MIVTAVVEEVEANAVGAVAEADLTYLSVEADLEVGEEETGDDGEEVILAGEEEGSGAVEISDQGFTRAAPTIPTMS